MAKNKYWLLVDVGIILFLLSMIFWEGIHNGDSHLGAVFFVAIGLLSITSDMMKDKLYFSKGIYWVVKNIFKPKTKFNHFIWGVFFMFIGFAILMAEPLSSSQKEFFSEVKSSREFWIAFLLVLLFNILVGVYTAKQDKNKNRDSKRKKQEKSESPER